MFISMLFLLDIFILLIVFQFKHFLADFPLQNKYMLQKFKVHGWFLPLAAHAGVHAGFTFLIALYVTQTISISCYLAIFDFVVHATMDRIKASPRLLGTYSVMSAKDFREANQAIDSNYTKLGQEGWGRPSRVSFQREIDDCDKRIRHNTYFWWALGLDQMVHHITHYVIIAVMLLHGYWV